MFNWDKLINSASEWNAGWTLNDVPPGEAWDLSISTGEVLESVATYLPTGNLSDNIFYSSCQINAPVGVSFLKSGDHPKFTIEMTNDTGTLGWKYEHFEAAAKGAGAILTTLENVSVNGGSYASTIHLRKRSGFRYTTYNPVGSTWAGTTETQTWYGYEWFSGSASVGVPVLSGPGTDGNETPGGMLNLWSANDNTSDSYLMPSLHVRFFEDVLNNSSPNGWMDSATLGVPAPHARSVFLPRGLWQTLRLRVTNDGTPAIVVSKWDAYKIQNIKDENGMDCSGDEGTPPAPVASVNSDCNSVFPICASSSPAGTMDAFNSMSAYVSSKPYHPSGSMTFKNAVLHNSDLCLGESTSVFHDDKEKERRWQLWYARGTAGPPLWLTAPDEEEFIEGPDIYMQNCFTAPYQYEYYYYEYNYIYNHNLPLDYLGTLSPSNPYTYSSLNANDVVGELDWTVSWNTTRPSQSTNTVSVTPYMFMWHNSSFQEGFLSGGTGSINAVNYNEGSWPLLQEPDQWFFSIAPQGIIPGAGPNCSIPTTTKPYSGDTYLKVRSPSTWATTPFGVGPAITPQTIDLCIDTFPKTLTFTVPDFTLSLPNWIILYWVYGLGIARCDYYHTERRTSQCPYVPQPDEIFQETRNTQSTVANAWLRAYGGGSTSTLISGLTFNITITDPYSFKSKVPQAP